MDPRFHGDDGERDSDIDRTRPLAGEGGLPER